MLIDMHQNTKACVNLLGNKADSEGNRFLSKKTTKKTKNNTDSSVQVQKAARARLSGLQHGPMWTVHEMGGLHILEFGQGALMSSCFS